MAASKRPVADIAYLCRALKAPSLGQAFERLAERARADGWTHEEFLAACLEREVAARQSNGGELRIRAARFPARKTLEDFDFDHQRSLKRDVIAHLGALDFVDARDNVVFLGPPGTGKTASSMACSTIVACSRAFSACSRATSEASRASRGRPGRDACNAAMAPSRATLRNIMIVERSTPAWAAASRDVSSPVRIFNQLSYFCSAARTASRGVLESWTRP
jgi:hypothetical protein